jgi:hypothetical protein
MTRVGARVVSFSAIAEIDEEHIVEAPFGRKTFVRELLRIGVFGEL